MENTNTTNTAPSTPAVERPITTPAHTSTLME